MNYRGKSASVQLLKQLDHTPCMWLKEEISVSLLLNWRTQNSPIFSLLYENNNPLSISTGQTNQEETYVILYLGDSPPPNLLLSPPSEKAIPFSFFPSK